MVYTFSAYVEVWFYGIGSGLMVSALLWVMGGIMGRI